MTETYKAIGKYRLDATDDEKIAACREALSDAFWEMNSLGVSKDDIIRALEDAADDAYNELPEDGDAA